MKYIEMTTPRGKYRLPLKVVATNRAEYYAENDGFDKGTNEWNEEIDFIMNDTYEGIDWLCNNMDYEDVESFLEKIDEPEENNEWWFDSDNFNIVEN